VAPIYLNYNTKIQGQLSNNFEVKKEIRQGDALDTVPFNFMLETVNKKNLI
jgi:hypothetical protein